MYYDFEYPNANRMMLITEWIAGIGTQSDQFNLTIPEDVTYYRYGIFTPEQLSADDTLHMVIVEQYVSSGHYGRSCVSFVLIYQTS